MSTWMTLGRLRGGKSPILREDNGSARLLFEHPHLHQRKLNDRDESDRRPSVICLRCTIPVAVGESTESRWWQQHGSYPLQMKNSCHWCLFFCSCVFVLICTCFNCFNSFSVFNLVLLCFAFVSLRFSLFCDNLFFFSLVGGDVRSSKFSFPCQISELTICFVLFCFGLAF
jgi:hypothetical protein